MPTAPPTRCTDPACRAIATNRGRCDDHQPPPWRGRPSWKQRYGMPVSQWRKLRDRILTRDEHRCYICGRDGADQVDHIIPRFEGGAEADPANLAAIHERPCHEAKSKGEAARANARRKVRS